MHTVHTAYSSLMGNDNSNKNNNIRKNNNKSKGSGGWGGEEDQGLLKARGKKWDFKGCSSDAGSLLLQDSKPTECPWNVFF